MMRGLTILATICVVAGTGVALTVLAQPQAPSDTTAKSQSGLQTGPQAGAPVEIRHEIRLIEEGPDGGPDVAWRERGRPGGGDPFGMLDDNDDGVITRQEFNTWRSDKRRDVLMFRGGAGGPPGAMRETRQIRVIRDLNDMDADKDGKVSFDEFAAPMKRHFDEIDADRNGSLSGDELKPPPVTSAGR